MGLYAEVRGDNKLLSLLVLNSKNSFRPAEDPQPRSLISPLPYQSPILLIKASNCEVGMYLHDMSMTKQILFNK